MIGDNRATVQTTLPEADLVRQQCQAAQARHHFFRGPTTPPADQPQPVVVAVSGGADSVALLHLLHSLASPWQIALHVAHVDHNLRPESAADAHFVAQLAAQWQLPFHLQRLAPTDLAKSGEGIEAAGRRARYRFLTEVALTITPPEQIPVIALAHHADDQAETLLLHLVRGSGLRGLGGMRWVATRRAGDLWPDAPPDRQQQRIQLVRPLLGVQRADLLRYLRTQDLTWREDRTNQDLHFARNRLRHTILPTLAALNPQVVQSLTRTAEILQQDAERLAAIDQSALVALLIEPTWSLSDLQAWQAQSQAHQRARALSRVVLDGTRLATLPTATQRGVLREAYSLVTSGITTPDFAHIETLLQALQPPLAAGGPHSLVADVAWSIAGAVKAAPARLSLHHVTALPFAPIQPFLAEAWRTTIGSCPLPAAGTLAIDQGWTLKVVRLPIQALPADWRGQGDGWQVYLDADQLGHPVLTTPHPGHVFAPLGMNGRHKTVGDFFTDRKVPTALRVGWPLLVDQTDNTVLWISGYQPSHRARITEQTTVVLRLAWSRDDKVTR